MLVINYSLWIMIEIHQACINNGGIVVIYLFN